MEEDHANTIKSLKTQHAQVVADKDMTLDRRAKLHNDDTEKWRVEKTQMETRHGQELKFEQDKLATRESNHKTEISNMQATHKRAMEVAKDKFDAAIKSLEQENSLNQTTWLSAELNLKTRISANEMEHIAEVTRMNDSHALEIKQLNAKWAEMRIQKDDEIAKLRVHYDALVADGLNKLKVMTDKFLKAEKEISTLTATILVLETEIITFKDVTEQLNMSRANAETIFAEKAKL
jgi:hypothetical protein